MADTKPSLSQRISGFPIVSFLWIVMLALLMMQVFSYLVGFLYSPASGVKLGWVILIVAAAIAVWLSTQIIQKRIIETRGMTQITRGEIIVIILMTGAVIAAMVYLPVLVPQAFDQAVVQLQSVVGLP